MFEEPEKQIIHSANLSSKEDDLQLGHEDLADGLEIEWLEESGKEDETIEFLTSCLNIIPKGLIFKYTFSICDQFKYKFETKESAIEFIKKVKSNPNGMEQECEELGLYTNTGPCWQRHVNFAQLFKIDYESLTRICLIDKKYVPNKETFEDKYFKLTLDGMTAKSHLSLGEIYKRILDCEIENHLKDFKHVKTASIGIRGTGME